MFHLQYERLGQNLPITCQVGCLLEFQANLFSTGLTRELQCVKQIAQNMARCILILTTVSRMRYVIKVQPGNIFSIGERHQSWEVMVELLASF